MIKWENGVIKILYYNVLEVIIKNIFLDEILVSS